MRELEFLPPWYPQLRRNRRTLSLRAAASALLAATLACAAFAAHRHGGPPLDALAMLAAAATAVVGGVWILTRHKLARLSVASFAASTLLGARGEVVDESTQATPKLNRIRFETNLAGLVEYLGQLQRAVPAAALGELIVRAAEDASALNIELVLNSDSPAPPPPTSLSSPSVR